MKGKVNQKMKDNSVIFQVILCYSKKNDWQCKELY